MFRIRDNTTKNESSMSADAQGLTVSYPHSSQLTQSLPKCHTNAFADHSSLKCSMQDAIADV